ncbi:hypothetical protein EBZ37_02530, partial [bacterium]|nr:hypothetical protein [bacterium]
LRPGVVWVVLSTQLVGCPGKSAVKRDPSSWQAEPAVAARPIREEPLPQAVSSFPAVSSEAPVPPVDAQVYQAHLSLDKLDPQSQVCQDCTSQPQVIPPSRPAGSRNVDTELLDSLVEQALAQDQNCRKVFTGNAGSYELLSKSGYAKTFARAFAQDVCHPVSPTVLAVQSASPSSAAKDALARSAFTPFVKTSVTDGDLKNLAATYSLSYSLGLRESSGKFSQGRDKTASNTSLLTEEAGAFQVSSNTLGSKDQGGKARREIFSKYVLALSDARSGSEGAASQFAAICDIREAAEMPRGNRSSGALLKELQNIFQTGSECDRVASLARQGADSLSGATVSRGKCFMRLQKSCPAFAVKYNTVTVRTLADHFGPLKLKGRAGGGKPTIEPQCRAIFDLILAHQEQVCQLDGSGAASPARSEVAATAAEPSVVPIAPAPAVSVPQGAPVVQAVSGSPEVKPKAQAAESQATANAAQAKPRAPAKSPAGTPDVGANLGSGGSFDEFFTNPTGQRLEAKPGKVRAIEQRVSQVATPGQIQTDIVFGDSRLGVSPIILRVQTPDIACPKEFSQGPGICFHGSPHSKKIMMLDPGHADSKADSSRNGFHDEVHEGQANMVVGLLTRQLLLKCAPYDPVRGTGIHTDAVRMSHYPGEVGYGDYERGYLAARDYPTWRKALGWNPPIQSKGGKTLRTHINDTIKYGDKKMSDSVMVSIHADAPDVFSPEVRKEQERPMIYVSRNRSESSKDLGNKMYEKLFQYTSSFYDEDQRRRFEPKDGGSNGVIVDAKARAAVMNAAAPGAEVILAEGFHMDGKVVGERIQRELHDCLLDENLKPVMSASGECVPNPQPAEAIQASFFDPNQKKWVPVEYQKTKITAQKVGDKIEYSSEPGEALRGMKVSAFYKAYAQSLAAGIAESYACPLSP